MQYLPPSEVVRNALQFSTLRLRQQQKLVVALSFAASSLRNFGMLLDEACQAVSKGLGSPFVKVLRYLPDEDTLLLTHGVGWDPEDIGHARLSTDNESPAGFAYSSGRAVISNHLSKEDRFRTPALLAKYDIKRAINVPIRGTTITYGVLEADSPNESDFAETDLVFLESVASVIAMAHAKTVADNEPTPVGGGEFSLSVLNASTDCIQVMDVHGTLEFINENGLHQLAIDDFSVWKDQEWANLWPDSQRAAVKAAIVRAGSGESMRFEAFCPTLKGEPKWWDVSVAPIAQGTGSVKRIVAVSRDITERHRQESHLATLVSQQENALDVSDLMMKEVHHRVRNSLQLVHTLLTLQANLVDDDLTKNQLKVAANRVMTVGSVHERLYQGNGIEATDAALYLTGLVEDLRKAFDERPIVLHAPSLILPANRLAPLGLVTSELITNALKYGRGRIDVSLIRQDDALLLTVSDEGSGFPENFPKPQGTGLGMRLIRTYAGYGTESVSIDRTVPYSKIQVKFRAS